ncbi:thioredoxin TrxA [Streptomyces anulatus]|uniref:thioredoxin TrxA n=1 Tax=Streptomyces anulatus TaxID=1892 RepID=UPI00340B0A10
MSGNTVDVTDAGFAASVLEAKGPVLVHFWAEWGGPCKMMQPILQDIAAEFDGRLLVAELNIDRNQKTAPKYDVTGIPTLLLFKGGKVTATRAGAQSKGQLELFLEENL